MYQSEGSYPPPSEPPPPPEVVDYKLKILQQRITLVVGEASKLSPDVEAAMVTDEMAAPSDEVERAAKRAEVIRELFRDRPLGPKKSST